MNGSPNTDAARDTLLRLFAGKWVVAALTAAVDLGVPDALRDGPRSIGELATAAGAEPQALGRLLRVLATQHIVSVEGDQVTLLPLGRELCSDRLGPLAAFVGAPHAWDPWARLADAIRSDRTAFELTHGVGLFPFLADRAVEGAAYDAAIDAFTRAEAQALAAAIDLGDARQVVDVGGGLGSVLIELVGRHPKVTGVLYDLPPVAERAAARFEALGLADRCSAQGGDFLAGVPAGADVYVVKHVLHNWDDDDAARILGACAAGMTPGGRVLVVEGLLIPGGRADGTRLLDLEMLVLCGHGRERSKPEFRALIGRAGLRLQRTVDLGASRILECVAR
ncbi:MAG: methyltransferase [Myxococcales bacterium]|nr:methyltransferase [Myxococcales bacterium]MCB9530370.1 methyltransferase [Myxococcales bacterium]